MADRAWLDEIVDELRKSICEVPPLETSTLKEVDLAERFNVSRTPIRQVLQELERENLITIRAGKGSQVIQMDPSDRPRHFMLFRDILDAASRYYVGQPISHKTMVELAIVVRRAEDEPRAVSLYSELNYRLFQSIAAEIHDPVLSSAVMSLFVRIFRWRHQDLRQDLDGGWQSFVDSIRAMQEASQGNDVGDLLREFGRAKSAFATFGVQEAS